VFGLAVYLWSGRWKTAYGASVYGIDLVGRVDCPGVPIWFPRDERVAVVLQGGSHDVHASEDRGMREDLCRFVSGGDPFVAGLSTYIVVRVEEAQCKSPGLQLGFDGVFLAGPPRQRIDLRVVLPWLPF
jgi:hypothetical protein